MKVWRTCPEHRTFVWNITRDADRLSPCSIFRPPKRRHANAQRRDVDGSERLPMQTPLAVQLRQSPTPVAKGNESLRSASSPMHNVVPRKRNIERCKPFFVSPLKYDPPATRTAVAIVERRADLGTYAGSSTQAPCLGERTRAKTVAFSFARIVGNSLANDIVSSPCRHGPCSSRYVWIPVRPTSPCESSPSRRSSTTLRLPAGVSEPAP